MAAITVERVTFTLTLGTSFADVFQVGSGEKWTILRMSYQVIAQVGGPSLELERTDSADDRKELILDRAGLTVDPDSIVMSEDVSDTTKDVRSMVLTDQDKLRAQRVGATSATVEFTLSVVVET